jgi:hypothetical protein
MTCDELFSLYVPHLMRINPAFDESWVNSAGYFAAPTLARLHRGRGLARARPPHAVPGLYLANMAQLYPQDRGQNYSILLGENIAEIVASDLSLTETSEGEAKRREPAHVAGRLHELFTGAR